MLNGVVFLLIFKCIIMLVDQLMRVCAYIREQREKENFSVPGADEDKKDKKEV